MRRYVARPHAPFAPPRPGVAVEHARRHIVLGVRHIDVARFGMHVDAIGNGDVLLRAVGDEGIRDLFFRHGVHNAVGDGVPLLVVAPFRAVVVERVAMDAEIGAGDVEGVGHLHLVSAAFLLQHVEVGVCALVVAARSHPQLSLRI